MALISPIWPLPVAAATKEKAETPPSYGTATLPEAESAIYVFRQSFRIPGDPQDQLSVRTGFIAQLRVKEFGDSIYPLQHSSPHDVETGACGLAKVVVLYRGTPSLPSITDTEVTYSSRDQFGVELKVWKLTDHAEIEQLLNPVSGQQLILASGKAHYDAALSAGQEWITAAFLSIDDPGLVLLPLHRVVRDKPDFKTGILVMNSRAYFFFQEVTRSMQALEGDGPHFESHNAARWLQPDPEEAIAETVSAEEAGALVSPGSAHNSIVRADDIVMLAVTRKQTFRMHCQPGWADHVLADVPAHERNVDVVQLEKIILEGVLELPRADIRAGKYVSYYRDALEAVREFERGADVAFIMSTPKVHDLCNLALSGVVLPHNSAEIYPSMDGLSIHAFC